MKPYFQIFIMGFVLFTSAAGANYNSGFIDLINVLNSKVREVKKFEHVREEETMGEGIAQISKLLNNVYVFEYDYTQGSKGIFLLSYDLQDESFYLSHINEGAKMNDRFITGYLNPYGIAFKVDGEEVISIELQPYLVIKFLNEGREVSYFRFIE